MRDALAALTPRGRAFVAAGLTITACAILLGYGALMRVGILALALPLITAFMVGRVRYRLMARRVVDPQRVSRGQVTRVELNLVNNGRLPVGMLLFEDQLPLELGTIQRFTLDRMGSSWARTVGYDIVSGRRGHFEIGPLAVRVSDPFGFIALTRSFRTTSRLVVTPTVTPLPHTIVGGAIAESGERRMRASSSGTAEDVTVREYRRGDDLRRVHWRSTARSGELMVRREEEPWQNRATVLLDTRRHAHTIDATGSLEWAVEAAASICIHLSSAGYAVRLVTDRSESAESLADTSGLILDELAAVRPSAQHAIADLGSAATRGVVISVLGSCTAHELDELNRQAAGASRKLAVLLDVDRFRGDRAGVDLGQQQRSLRDKRWRVVVAEPGSDVAHVWAQLSVAPAVHEGIPT